ncbi:hypothetical protein [Motilimonas eburnea]|uniref:hypothetical protein n=1 Tax=Motilimonas eburnea TaxID=1737488 RepID=UPI001E423504|nr:hypothetical protein [Motilimonas eburnea]MCE2572337.1 hypothetical protein [Motilimonas eburnea]
MFFLFACTEKTTAYYELNEDEAKSKLVECSFNYFSAENVPSDLTQLTFADKECEAARKARLVEKHRQLQVLQQRVDHQALQQYDEQKQQLLALSYAEYAAVNGGCGWSDVTLLCQVASDIEDDMFAKEVARLRNGFKLVELEGLVAQRCRGGEHYVRALCYVAQTALGQQQTQQVSYLLSNQAALKRQYNACRVELMTQDALNDEAAIADFLAQQPQCALVMKTAKLMGQHSLTEPL